MTGTLEGVISGRFCQVLVQALESDRIELAVWHAASQIGVSSLNARQKQAVRAFVDRKNVFVSLRTGFGKSVCFQSLPFVFDYLHNDPESSSFRDRRIRLRLFVVRDDPLLDSLSALIPYWILWSAMSL